MSLSRLPRHRVVESAAQSLLAFIVDEGLKPGDELPAQGTLSEQLGIGQYSTREAVQRLVALGVIDLQQGKRMTVGRTVEGGLVADIQVLNTSLRHQALVELSEVRTLLEPEVAALAAARASLSQIQGVRAVVEEMRGVREPARAAVLNSRFHLALTECSGNRVAARLLLAMQDNLTQVLGELYRWLYQQDAEHNDADDHLDICAALEARDADRVRDLMRRHMQIALARESLVRDARE
jgi:GntR family transcriptional regulator, transcriptional repressor for pyruvate dehydrogenase complex